MTEIRTVEIPAQRTAVVREQMASADLPGFFDRTFSTLMRVLEAQGVQAAGPPFALYHGAPEQTVDVEAGFPVSGTVEPDGDVRPGSLPACRAVEAVHVGPYDSLAETYGEIMRWMQERGLQPAEDMWEQYLTDPSAEPDPADWRTVVVCPLR